MRASDSACQKTDFVPAPDQQSPDKRDTAGLVSLIGLSSLLAAFSLFSLAIIILVLYVLVRGARTGPLARASYARQVDLNENGPLDAGV